MANGHSVRQPAVAGQFYPAERGELQQMIEAYLAKTQAVEIPGKIKALIVPHAGYVYSGQTAAYGYRQLKSQITNHKSQKIRFVLIGPTHRYPFENLVADDHEEWETPLGRVKQRIPVPNKLVQVNGLPHRYEHCLEVQVPFLQSIVDRLQLTAFLTGVKVDSDEVAEYLDRQYPESLFVISTDLSHYLPLSEAELLDQRTVRAMEQQDVEYFLKEGNTACGRLGVAIALTMAKREGWKTHIVHYETSARAFGDASRVVGYVSAAFYQPIATRG